MYPILYVLEWRSSGMWMREVFSDIHDARRQQEIRTSVNPEVVVKLAVYTLKEQL